MWLGLTRFSSILTANSNRLETLMNSSRKLTYLLSAALIVLGSFFAAQAQVTTGGVRGVVTDPNGAAVTNAKVTITKKSTNVSTTTETGGAGQFEFNNLLVGDDYSVAIEAPSFKTLTLTDVKIQLNQATDLSA